MDRSISKPCSQKSFTSISNCKLTTFSKVSLTSVFVYHLVMIWIHTKRMKQNLNISTPLDALDGDYSIFKIIHLTVYMKARWWLSYIKNNISVCCFVYENNYVENISYKKPNQNTKQTQSKTFAFLTQHFWPVLVQNVIILLKISKWLYSLPKLG